MKKRYEKPVIFFEDFSVSTNIAAGCEHSPEDEAQWFDGIGWVFLDMMNSCKDFILTDAGGDGEFNNICYHVTTNENFFTS